MKAVKFGYVCVSALALVGFSAAAFAQEAPAAPAAGRQGGQRRGQQGVQIAMIPASVLAPELKLTNEQVTKIKAVQDKLAEETKALRPVQGQQPDRDALVATFQKMRELNDQANKDIDAILTDEQKNQAPALVRDMATMQQVGIPVGVLPELKLSEDQKTKIKGVVDDMQRALRGVPREERRTKTQELRQAATEKVNAILTDTQKASIEKYRKDNPTLGRGQRRNPNGGNPPQD